MERSDVPPGDNQLKNATLIAFGGRRVAPQAPTKFDESRSESARAGSRVEKVTCLVRRYSAAENCPERIAV